MAVTVNGYVLEKDWTLCANGDFAFATKAGKEFFIKRLPSPKYPADKNDYTPKSYERNLKLCKEFQKYRGDIIAKLNGAAKKCGSLIVPNDFFRVGKSYYLVSKRIRDRILTPDEITKLNETQKHQLITEFATALVALQDINMVHGDLKPSNVFICKSGAAVHLYIMDFDDCYYSEKPPECEATMGSVEYYSPELGAYINMEDPSRGNTITCKSDVFAAGLMIHEYLSGKKVKCSKKYPFMADDDSDITLLSIPVKYSELLKEISCLKNIRVRGLMCIPPADADTEKSSYYFQLLRHLSIDIKGLNIDNIQMDILSMGMTSDYEAAIKQGADMVRVGTGIFGMRDYSK